MRKHFTIGLILAFVVLSVGAVVAGDYHNGDTLKCYECHTMHYSQNHTYTGGAQPTTGPGALGAGGPHEYLLRSNGNDLCLACHDGQTTAPDVYAANTNTYVRQAGALNKEGDTGDYATYKGHTLGSTATAPGGTFVHASIGLQCIDCHQQHAYTGYGMTYPTGYVNKQWRNLIGQPGTAASTIPVTYAKTTNDTTLDIFERDPALGQLSTHYAVGNQDFNEPTSTASAIASWCQGCHTDFHGDKGSTNMGGNPATNHDWKRHPVADINIGAQSSGGHSSISEFAGTGKTTWVQVMSKDGNWDYATADATREYTPSCFSCHKSHGNKNPFGLLYMKGTGTLNEEGDTDGTQAKDLCKQCHVQG